MRSSSESSAWWFAPWVAAGIALLAIAMPAAAQDGPWSDSPSIEFPNVWVGSNPIELADLKGKAALLYFYEESCPTCTKRWPGIQAVARKYADKPIAFVAVNSGTPAPLVMQYARGVRLSWPVIVDLDRSFEKACNVGEISLKNIAKVVYITPKGEMRPGSFSKIEDTIERALKGARWNIEPSEIPAELWPVWRSIEFAQYAPAAKPLSKAKSSRKAEVKAAAEKLAQLVDQRATEAMDRAKDQEQKSKLRAYRAYAAIAEGFAGYPAATKATVARRKLARDPEYRKEVNAVKLVERQRALANSPKPAVRKRAAATIQKIIDEQPDSEAARLGRQILQGQAIFEVK